MKRRTVRRVFNGVAALCLLVSAATVALWVRSYQVVDDFWHWDRRRVYHVSSAGGWAAVLREPIGPRSTIPPTGYRHDVWSGRGLLGNLDFPTLYARPPGRSAAEWEVWILRYRNVATVSALPAGLWVALRWRSGRRKVPGACPQCGYDLRATPGRCPECGKIFANAVT